MEPLLSKFLPLSLQPSRVEAISHGGSKFYIMVSVAYVKMIS